MMNKPNEHIAGETMDTARADDKAASSKMVTGLFRDRDSAELAYGSITSRGYNKSDVNLVMSDETRKKHFPDDSGKQSELGNKAADGAGIGGAIGGTIGAIAAALAAVGTSIAIPGLGLVIAGPIAAALAGTGAGGLTGGLVGALVDWGIPEERVRHYEAGINEGAGAKELIVQLEAMQPDDDLYDAKVIVLGEQIEHHAREEEEEMFPKVKKSGINTAALGAQMMKKKNGVGKRNGLIRAR